MSKKKSYKKPVFKILIILLLIVFCIRMFIVDSATVANQHMITSLYKDDRVFIDKTAYGVRMPMTLLTIPFTFDSFLGFKSYSELLPISYKRVYERSVGRNDIVLFNNPIEFSKPIDKRNLIVSRCVALPGDTLEKKAGDILINSESYLNSPDLVQEYRIGNIEDSVFVGFDEMKDFFKESKTPIRGYSTEGTSMRLKLNKHEYYLYQQNSEYLPRIAPIEDTASLDYSLIVPYKDFTIRLDKNNIMLYSSAIYLDSDGIFVHKDGKIVGKSSNSEIYEYRFKSDFYWFLSDNKTDAIDSEILGFVPMSHVVGRISYIWYSSDSRQVKFDRYIGRSYN